MRDVQFDGVIKKAAVASAFGAAALFAAAPRAAAQMPADDPAYSPIVVRVFDYTPQKTLANLTARPVLSREQKPTPDQALSIEGMVNSSASNPVDLRGDKIAQQCGSSNVETTAAEMRVPSRSPTSAEINQKLSTDKGLDITITEPMTDNYSGVWTAPGTEIDRSTTQDEPSHKILETTSVLTKGELIVIMGRGNKNTLDARGPDHDPLAVIEDITAGGSVTAMQCDVTIDKKFKNCSILDKAPVSAEAITRTAANLVFACNEQRVSFVDWLKANNLMPPPGKIVDERTVRDYDKSLGGFFAEVHKQLDEASQRAGNKKTPASANGAVSQKSADRPAGVGSTLPSAVATMAPGGGGQ